MGCICTKPSAVKDSEESPKLRELIRMTSQLNLARAVSTKREPFLENEKTEEDVIPKLGSRARRSNASERAKNDYHENKVESSEGVSTSSSMGSIPRAVEAESIAADWPPWLVSVAGEAIRGWTPRKAETFEKLDKIGQGTYSTVYKGRDLIHNRFVALKKVRFNNMDPESVKFMTREIMILRRLDHPNIIKLEGLITSKSSSSLYLVFEYMEHDLTGIASLPGIKFTEPQMKCYMHQLLSGLDYCHRHGVLHRDIKGSNLLIDNKGILKIADFGLATYFDSQLKIPLTSRVVTLWYRPPELLLGAIHYGVAIDLWSAGCILGELYTGRPIMTGRNEVEQLHNIFKLCGSPSADYWKNSKLTYSAGFKMYRRRIAEAFKDLPDAAVALMETLLSINPSDRGTAGSALDSEFFRTEPLACEPSSLPKYPPSKEIDAKLREDEAKTQGAQGAKGMKGGNGYRGSKELQDGRSSDATSSSNFARSTNSYNPQGGGKTLANPQPSRSAQGSGDVLRNYHSRDSQEGVSYSGPLPPNAGWKSHRKASPVDSTGKGLWESRGKMVSSDVDSMKQISSSSEAQDTRLQARIFPGSHQAKSSRVTEEDDDAGGDAERVKDYHFSGPLLASSGKIEQVLRDHDRLIQEASRRMRQQEKAKGSLHQDRRFGFNRFSVSGKGHS